MNNSYEVEKILGDWLSSFSSQEIEFRNSYQAIIGYPSDGFRSDGMLTDGKVLITIEVEAGQTHPDTNVGKYWMLLDNHKNYSKAILFHIFTPAFNSYEWRMKLALYYAKKMEESVPFEYKLYDFRHESNLEESLELVKSDIKINLKQYFGIS